ncbi:MAG: DUF2993 domain-containing protein [Jatrophihabitans sp.]|nr:MAG: DUF2993 domain-containing protein [Jatrophihabitans sp.]
MLIDVLVVVAVVAALVLAAALADRTLVSLAERKASEYLAEPFDHPPAVRVHGAPFLTQVIRGRYGRIEVAGGGLRVGEIAGASLQARLSNVYLPARDLLLRRATELPCERVAGSLVLPYGELARVSRVPGLALAFQDGRLVASASLPVPGISQLARVSGRAALTLDGGTVWLRVSGLSVAGLSVTALVIRQLLPHMNVPIPLPPLPWGLRLEQLHAAESGIVVEGAAAAVVFRPVVRPEQRDGRPVE